ncbi:MAG: DUF2089 family protein [Planctomycetota bacterium]|nr:MAG: DUF2089 family protein [Planctomycetota bacterium]
MTEPPDPEHPIRQLSREDLDFILRLVLASGSLKELAAAYQVSYPTIRQRLNRLIERVKRLLPEESRDPMSEALADLVERGEITLAAAKSLQRLHRKLRQQENS